jgi:aldehyde:ferredoxin oxidoreductase
LGIYSPEDNVFLVSLIDDLGLCGIQTGNVLGFVAELFQRGILTDKDLDGVKPVWGDAEAFAALARKIAFRDGIGNVLAEGTYRAALKIGKMKGVDVMPYAVQSKAIGIGAHGIRSEKDFVEIYGYACSVQGGDHTSTATMPINDFRSELMMIFNDSAVYCYFNIFGLSRSILFEFYKAVTGLDLTMEEWVNTKALKTLQLQRAMLLLGGPDLKWNPKIHDDNPPRFYEPLPSGPFKGKVIDRAVVMEEVKKYYEAVGWDENGIPKTETLKKLGLDDVDKALEKLR